MEEFGLWGRFESLPEQEAMDLLRTYRVGRIAWETAAGPMTPRNISGRVVVRG